MVNPPNSSDDFYARALASFNHQMTVANDADAPSTTDAAIDIESYAKSLVEDDLPKIDSAVKSYLSLVAARSASSSGRSIDVLPSSTNVTSTTVQCTFAASAKKTPIDANRCALVCARTLLSAINSTIIPSDSATVEGGSIITAENDGGSEEEKVKKIATEILWNKLVQSSVSSTGDKAKQSKPSKVLGRSSLLVAYPYIQERFRRGIQLVDDSDENGKDATTSQDESWEILQNGVIVASSQPYKSPTAINDTTKTIDSQTNPLHSLSNEVLPPANPPKGIDLDQFEAFYVEFGNLLSRACINDGEKKQLHSSASPLEDNDSALVWSSDKGMSELQSRRKSRAQRASEALASVDGAKKELADALGS